MRIDPAIAALRGDPAPQLAAQQQMAAALAEWRTKPETGAVIAGFADYAAGRDLTDCSALAAALRDLTAARAFVTGVVSAVLPVLATHPLAPVPVRHQHGGGITTVQLAARGGAALALVLHDGAAFTGRELPATIAFVDSERHEICLAGGAEARLVTRTGPDDRTNLVQQTIRHRPGSCLTTDGATTARIVDRVAGRLLALRLSRTPAHPEPSREFRLADGALIHRASGDRGESRRLMALTVLARTGHRAAAPLLAELTREGGVDLRWQAVRELIAHDAAAGFAALTALARHAADPLAAPAGALRAQLMQAHPALAPEEMHPCPA